MTAQEATEPAEQAPSRSAWTALAVLLIAQAMANMDNSIVNVATKTIRDDLDASGAGLQIILAGYTLTFAVLVVTGARLGDDRGFRRMFLIGLVGFVISSLVCGIAPTAGVLVFARVLQGACGAIMVPQILSSIQTMFSGQALGRAVGYYSMILALGVAAGQIVGGALVSANLFGVTWRMAFLVNVPIGIALLLIGRKVLPHRPPAEKARFDLAGVILLGVSMALVVVPLIFGREQGWPAWTWIVLALGMIGIVLFVRYEMRLLERERRPLLDLQALRPAGVRPGLLALCLLNFSFAGILFPTTLHLQEALGYSPLQAGLMFLPYPIGFATISLTWTKLPKTWHPVLPVAGLLAFTVAAAGLLATVRAGWPVPLAAAVLCLAGAGMAAGMSPLIAQVAEAVGPKHASAVSAILTTGALLFSVFAVTAAGGVYLSLAQQGVEHSADAISWTFGLVAVLLALATACAARTWYVATRGKPSDAADDSQQTGEEQETTDSQAAEAPVGATGARRQPAAEAPAE